MQIDRDEGIFLTTDRTEIYQQSWRSAVPPRAIIAIVHGYAEHSGRYTRLATDLVRAGYHVYSFDLRGHGKSSGDRCYVDAIGDYLADLDLFLERICQQSPDLELFLLGHSLGGAIALRYALESNRSIGGLMLSAPFLGQQDRANPAPMVVKLVGALSRLLPKLPTFKLDTSLLSRDPAIVQQYLTDPLVDLDRTPLRTVAEITANIQQIQDRHQEIDLPILIMHGTQDGIAGAIHSEMLYAGIRSADKSLKLYPGLYHEIFNEPERDRVLADLLDWLGSHI
jgi:acylglycerol lipase